MDRKTKIHSEPGRQDLLITREFDIPLELLFTAYTEAEIVAQWMGTKVIKLESKKHGSWQFETSDGEGNIVFRANGVIHEIVPNQKITRTFEMENTPFPAQLEFLEFEAIDESRSKLNMQIVYRSVALRDQLLKLPFAYGLNMAHDKLEAIFNKTK
ncbi:MAG: SRPBCC domain-containing protein [Saprospiraceae bacterium]